MNDQPNRNGTSLAAVAPTGWPRLVEALFAPVDILPLALFRMVFGLLMVCEVWRYFHYGWIDLSFIEPKFHFTYYGFGWVHPWPGIGMKVHFLVLGILGAAITLGLFYRVVTVLFFLGFTYVFLLDESVYLNHFYLICLYSFLLIFAPTHRAWSLDARRRSNLRSATAPAWSLWALRTQICIVYLMGGVAKLSSDWLHGQPMRLWLERRADFPVIGRFFHENWIVYAFSYGGLLFDLLIVPLVLWRRTRWLAFLLSTLFNLMNARLFQIGIFPWLSLGATVLLFADFSGLSRSAKLVEGDNQGKEHGGMATGGPPGRRQFLGAALLAAWLCLQLLVPLRHLVLYPGSPEWSEEGHRFAWRMKLRDKEGKLELQARNPTAGEHWTVDPLDYITADQLDDSSDSPEMILQLCHHVAEEWRRQHHVEIEVRAIAEASLNGRPMQSLIDPEVNLAAQPRTLRHARWIKPLTTPLDAKEPGTSDPAASPGRAEGIEPRASSAPGQP